jgi:hypothetical protein
MGKIVISTNVSLDGVVQDPDGKEGYERGGWFGQSGGQDLERWAQIETEEAARADALLLGRRSDEWFGSRWSTRTGAWADRLNSLPKYVASTTLEDPVWQNSTVLRGETTAAVARRYPGSCINAPAGASSSVVHRSRLHRRCCVLLRGPGHQVGLGVR